MSEPGWPGARNLRDLGGRALRDGGVTAPGRVFRSGASEYLTDEGWRAAKAAGLRTVIDLHNAAETGRAADHPAVAPQSLSPMRRSSRSVPCAQVRNVLGPLSDSLLKPRLNCTYVLWHLAPLAWRAGPRQARLRMIPGTTSRSR